MDNTGEVIALIKGLSKGGGGSGGITVKDAKVGQLIRAKAVDETGNITEYEPVPFMYEDVQETVTFPEQEVSGFEDQGDGTWLVADNLGMNPETINNGDVFFVNWDGVSYKCTAVVIQTTGAVFIGNAIIAGDSGENTGEPFLYLFFRGSPTWFTDQPGPSHTIGISTISSELAPVPIPPQYYNHMFVNITKNEAEPETYNVDKSFLELDKAFDAGFVIYGFYKKDKYVAVRFYDDVTELDTILFIGQNTEAKHLCFKFNSSGTALTAAESIPFSPKAVQNVIQYGITKDGKTIGLSRVLLCKDVFANVPENYQLYINEDMQLVIADNRRPFKEYSYTLPTIKEMDEGAILQVVNGIPKWVKLTNRAEVGG